MRYVCAFFAAASLVFNSIPGYASMDSVGQVKQISKCEDSAIMLSAEGASEDPEEEESGTESYMEVTEEEESAAEPYTEVTEEEESAAEPYTEVTEENESDTEPYSQVTEEEELSTESSTEENFESETWAEDEGEDIVIEETSQTADEEQEEDNSYLVKPWIADQDAGGDELTAQLFGSESVFYAADAYSGMQTVVTANAWVSRLLEYVGAGYSQTLRNEPDFYDCSSLICRTLEELGITVGVPISTRGWDSLCKDKQVGDILTFTGTGGSMSFELVARDAAVLDNQGLFSVPGTIMVYIIPGSNTGHAAVSLGSYARQTNNFDPYNQSQLIVDATLDYVRSSLASKYGVSKELLEGKNRYTGTDNVWMDSRYLGTDMRLSGNTYSGEYNSIFRIEALSEIYGVCIDNLSHASSQMNKVTYALRPVEQNNPSETVILSAEKSNVTKDGYQATIRFIAPAGVKNVKAAAWTEKNEQDDLVVYQPTVDAAKGAATVYIPISDHNEESGNYITRFTIEDAKGQIKQADLTVTVPISDLNIVSVKESDVTEKGYWVTVTFEGSLQIKQVLMPTWTEKDGQDDVVWHEAAVTGNTASCYIPVSEHNNETGVYITHVYVTDAAGNQKIESIEVTIPEAKKEIKIINLQIAEVTLSGYRVTATFNELNAENEVLFPTWTEKNGYDDLIWHQAEINGNAASFYVSVSVHKGEKGVYNTHVYVTDSGEKRIMGGIRVTVPEAKELTITDLKVTELTAEGYRVTAAFESPNEVKSVMMPTWTEKNGQDDLIWYQAKVTGNTATFYVPVSEHNEECGTYITHVYVTDATGKQILKEIRATVPEKGVVITGLKATEVTSQGYCVTVTFNAPNGIKSVTMPTWTEKNGQDDLVWHQAEIEGNSAVFYVPTAEHNGESGVYTTHVYVTDQTGKQAVAGIKVTVPVQSLTITDLKVTELTSAGYRVTVTFNAPNEVKSVTMPTWTEKNGQDDLIWHQAEIKGNSAEFYVSAAEHNWESGAYITHVYVTDVTGKEALRGINVTVPERKLAIISLKTAEATSEGYRVTVTFEAPNGVSKVEMPTWTERNGQDDLIWHTASISGNTATFFVRVSDHKGESGKYITHCYVYDTQGKYVLAGITQNVP